MYFLAIPFCLLCFHTNCLEALNMIPNCQYIHTSTSTVPNSQEDHPNFLCALAEYWCATDRPIKRQTRQSQPRRGCRSKQLPQSTHWAAASCIWAGRKCKGKGKMRSLESKVNPQQKLGTNPGEQSKCSSILNWTG